MHRTRSSRLLTALLVSVALVAAACSSAGDSEKRSEKRATAGKEEEPRPGGTLRVGIDAETSGGYCLPSAQLAAGGQYVADAVFDTLVKNDEDREPIPWLAESITPNADNTQFTFVLRDGVTFHDGTPLTAQAAVDNIEAWRTALLISVVFEDVSDVQVVDELTFTITTKRPWPGMLRFLVDQRFGIIAPAQLESPDCATKLIGTGPFKLEKGEPNVVTRVVKNEDYWQEGLPYLDAVEFVPIPDVQMRLNQLQSGDMDLVHSPEDAVSARLLDLGEQDGYEAVRLPNTGVNFFHFNTTKPPFDDRRVREIFAVAVDRDQIIATRLQGAAERADQHFADDQLGYVEDCGYPQYDQERAKKLVEEYEADKGPLKITLGSVNDSIIKDIVDLFAQDLEEAGVDTTVEVRDESAHINTALAGAFDTLIWREGAGGDPDLEYVWWNGGSPVNFSRFDDPVINEALATGRTSTDPDARKEAYETINRRICEQIYSGFLTYKRWTIAWKSSVHGVGDAELPDGNGKREFRTIGPGLLAVWVG